MALSVFSKNYAYTAAYQLFTLLVPLVTAPYLTRVLGASNVGINSYVASVASIITTIGAIGVYSYGTRAVAYLRDDRERLNELFWELMAVRIALLMVTSAMLFVFVQLSATPHVYYFVLYYPWVVAVFLDVSWIFVGTEHMKPVAIKNFFAKVIVVVGMLVFVQAREDTWKYLCLLSFGTLIANLSVYRELARLISRPRLRVGHLKRHLIGSLHLFLPQVAMVVYLQAGKVMIEALTGSTAQVAFYDQAEKIVLLPMTLITVLSTVMMPRIANEFSRARLEVVHEYVVKAGRVAMFCALPSAVGIASISIWFVPWYLGSEFRPTAVAVVILSPILMANALESISSGYFTATNQIGRLLFAYLSAALSAIVLNVLLIPRYGFAGSAAATLAASCVCAAIQLVWLGSQVPIRRIMYAGLRYFFMSMPVGAAALAIGFSMGPGVWTTLFQIVAGASVYVVISAIRKDEVLQDLSDRVRTAGRQLRRPRA